MGAAMTYCDDNACGHADCVVCGIGEGTELFAAGDVPEECGAIVHGPQGPHCLCIDGGAYRAYLEERLDARTGGLLGQFPTATARTQLGDFFQVFMRLVEGHGLLDSLLSVPCTAVAVP